MRDDHPLPNLSAWHELPASALIPAGTEYATLYPNGDIVVHTTDGALMPFFDDNRYFTEQRILPKLPTTFGSLIMITDGPRAGCRAVLVRDRLHHGWYVDASGTLGGWIAADEIPAFEVIHDG